MSSASVYRRILPRAATATLAAFTACQHAPASPPSLEPTDNVDVEALDNLAATLMKKEDVKGLGLALIEGGRVVHLRTFGYRNVERRQTLDPDTVMYGASFTKAAFAYMVLQLVDEKRFDLDRPLASYLKQPLPKYERYTDLDGDPRWQRLTARHVLTHSTGFANFRWLEDDKKLRFHFEPGTRYAYSGEGFYLLQFALEDGLGLDTKAEMQRRIFERFGMTKTSMQWRPDFAKNLADGYGIKGQFEPHDERSRVSAAGSMDTSIADQAQMWAGMIRGDGLSAASRQAFVAGRLPIRSAHQFPTLWRDEDPRAEAIGLSAGLGVVTFQAGDTLGWFKGGHNDWTGNFALCRERDQRCLIMMSNSVRAELIYPQLVEFVFPHTALPMWWEYHHAE